MQYSSDPDAQGPITDFSQSYTLNPDGTRASSTEVQLQPDGTIQTIDTSWTYDAQDRLTGESVSSAAGPDGLASGFTLLGDFSFPIGAGEDGAVAMTWDGANAYMSPGTNESLIGAEIVGYSALVDPAAAVSYGGNGSDWVLLASDGNEHNFAESFTLSGGVFAADGVVETGVGTTPAITIDSNSTGYNDTYTYDLVSNRMEQDHTGPGGGSDETTTYVYNGDDELTSQDSSLTGTTTNDYDANGSLTTSTIGSVVTTYAYDVRNKMVGYSDGTNSATYVYDDDGDRVKETTGGTTTLYLTDTQNPTGYDQPIEQKATSTSAPSMSYVLGDRVLGQENGSGVLLYLLDDGHGSTQQLTNATGGVATDFRYDAFGTAINFTTGSAGTAFLFGGDAIYDVTSGLYLHGNGTRPALNFEFIQRDTYVGDKQDPLSLHKYLYASANPIKDTDPTGHYTFGDVLISAGDAGLAEAENNVVADAAEGYAGTFISEFQQEEIAQTYFVDAVENGLSNTAQEAALNAVSDAGANIAAQSGFVGEAAFGGALKSVVTIVGGLATISVNYLHDLGEESLQEIVDYVRSSGATSAELDTGYVVNDEIAENLAERAADGRTYLGATVVEIPGGGLFPQFKLVWNPIP